MADNHDLNLLNAAILYIRQYSMKVHQGREELIFGHLICHFPTFERDVLFLLDEHHELEMRLGLLEREARVLSPRDPSSRHRFCDTVRAFVEYKASHIRAEEKFFYPSAERSLTTEDWAEVDRYLPNEQDPLCSETGYPVFAGLRGAMSQELERRSRAEFEMTKAVN